MTRTFKLVRHEDPSGVSGTGVVAHGAVFDDRSVALHWPGESRSTSIWDDIEAVERVHGHSGASEIVYDEASRGAPADGLVANLQAVTALIAGGMPFIGVDVATHRDRVSVHVKSEDWDAWVAALGGSTDTAIHEPHGTSQYTRHRWMSPDASLTCMHLTETETP